MHSISIPFLPRLRLDEPDEPIMKDAPNYAEFELREWRERPANGSPGFGAMALCFVDDEQMRRFLFVLQEEQLNPPRSTEELLITLILRALEERRSQ